MSFDLKIFLILVFIILNLSLFFNLKSKIGIIANISLSSLILIMFLSIAMVNENIFKELVIIFIIYMSLNVFLFLNQDEIIQKRKKIKEKLPNIKFLSIIIISAFVIFIALIFTTKITIKNLENSNKNQVESLFLENSEFAENFSSNQNNQNKLAKIISDFIIIICFILSFFLIISSSKKFFKKIK